MTTRRYLKSLERGHLTPDQWEQLSDGTVLRFARFPSIAELHDDAEKLVNVSPDNVICDEEG